MNAPWFVPHQLILRDLEMPTVLSTIREWSEVHGKTGQNKKAIAYLAEREAGGGCEDLDLSTLSSDSMKTIFFYFINLLQLV